MFDFRTIIAPSTDGSAGAKSNCRVRAGLCLVLGAVLAAFFSVYASRPETRYLASFDGISWILYPMAPNSIAFPVAQHTTAFSKTFRLEENTRLAVLKLRVFRDAEVRINGSRLTESSTNPKSWKSAAEHDVTSLLTKGDNRIEVTVNNSSGPPALWVHLDVDGRQIRSDSGWNCSLLGATETSAVTAATRSSLGPGHSMAHPEHLSKSLINLAPLLVALAVFWLLFFLVFFSARIRKSSLLSFIRRYDFVVYTLPIIGWLAIGVLNLSSLNFPMGHDADDHFEYIRYVQRAWRAPLANEGWEMHQPPVYYFFSAALLELFGDAEKITWNGGVLRIAALMTGMILILLTALCAKKVFSGQRLPVFLAVSLATSLPLLFVQTHSVSNDLLASALFSGAILAALHLVETPLVRTAVLLGLILGLSVLTKLTTLPPVGGLLIALGVYVIQQRPGFLNALKLVGVPLVVAVLVCGWYFIRNQLVFGQAVVGNFDEASGFRWWQYPGFTDASMFKNFGAGLESPFSAPLTSSILDGLYTTLWGDAGRDVFHRPPWNYEMMAVAVAFAVVPSLMAIYGLFGYLTGWCRRGDFPSLLLLGVFSAGVAGCLYYVLRLPYYSCVKSLFALPAIVPMCIFMARGLHSLMKNFTFLQFPLLTYVAFWVAVSLLSFRVVDADVRTSNYQCRQWIALGDLNTAKSIAEERIRHNEADYDAWEILGFALSIGQQGNDAILALERANADSTIDCHASQELAMLLENNSRFGEAHGLMRRIIAESPDWPGSYRCFAACARRSGGDLNEAVRIAREGLRVAPTDSYLHEEIGRLEMLRGETLLAMKQFEYAMRFDPQSVPSMVAIAWMRAASEDSSMRNSAEALKFADAACREAKPQQVFSATMCSQRPLQKPEISRDPFRFLSSLFVERLKRMLPTCLFG